MKKSIAVLLATLAGTQASAQTTTDSGIYTVDQAAAGRAVYADQCAVCHGRDLEGGEAGPELRGITFRNRWRTLPLEEFVDLTVQTMPLTNPAGLSPAAYANVVAYILSRSGFAAGDTTLTTDASQLLSLIHI